MVSEVDKLMAKAGLDPETGEELEKPQRYKDMVAEINAQYPDAPAQAAAAPTQSYKDVVAEINEEYPDPEKPKSFKEQMAELQAEDAPEKGANDRSKHSARDKFDALQEKYGMSKAFEEKAPGEEGEEKEGFGETLKRAALTPPGMVVGAFASVAALPVRAATMAAEFVTDVATGGVDFVAGLVDFTASVGGFLAKAVEWGSALASAGAEAVSEWAANADFPGSNALSAVADVTSKVAGGVATGAGYVDKGFEAVSDGMGVVHDGMQATRDAVTKADAYMEASQDALGKMASGDLKGYQELNAKLADGTWKDVTETNGKGEEVSAYLSKDHLERERGVSVDAPGAEVVTPEIAAQMEAEQPAPAASAAEAATPQVEAAVERGAGLEHGEVALAGVDAPSLELDDAAKLSPEVQEIVDARETAAVAQAEQAASTQRTDEVTSLDVDAKANLSPELQQQLDAQEALQTAFSNDPAFVDATAGLRDMDSAAEQAPQAPQRESSSRAMN